MYCSIVYLQCTYYQSESLCVCTCRCPPRLCRYVARVQPTHTYTQWKRAHSMLRVCVERRRRRRRRRQKCIALLHQTVLNRTDLSLFFFVFSRFFWPRVKVIAGADPAYRRDGEPNRLTEGELFPPWFSLSLSLSLSTGKSAVKIFAMRR